MLFLFHRILFLHREGGGMQCRCLNKPERASDLPELKVVSHPNWLLTIGPELKSSRKAPSTLIYRDILQPHWSVSLLS